MTSLNKLQLDPLPGPTSSAHASMNSSPAPVPIEAPDWVQGHELIHWLVNISGGSILGSALTTLGSLVAAGFALWGILHSVNQANQRATRDRLSAEDRASQDREGTDRREREKSRHDRFSIIIGQLASERPTVRMGGLYSLSALADEWQKEYERRRPPSGVEVKRPSAEDAAAMAESIGQRDVCIEILCSYLRARPIEENGREINVSATDEKNLAKYWASFPREMPDRTVREVAVAILGQHLKRGSAFKWPGNIIKLEGAHLQHANLGGFDLEGADLWGAHLQNARLEKTNLHGALLGTAELQDSFLHQTDFSSAVCFSANFDGAWMDETIMVGAVLSNATITANFGAPDQHNVKWVEVDGEQIKKAEWTADTTWPKNFSIEEEVDRQIDAVQKIEWDRVNASLSFVEEFGNSGHLGGLESERDYHWIVLWSGRRKIADHLKEDGTLLRYLNRWSNDELTKILERIESALGKFPITPYMEKVERTTNSFRQPEVRTSNKSDKK